MSTRKASGFTIVELLVVITIIGILMALLFPAINAARSAARKVNCTSNEGQIGKAILTATTKRGDFPKHLNTKGTPAVAWPWAANVMRELGRGDLADAMQAAGPAGRTERVDILICPADEPVNKETQQINYAVNAGKGDDASIAEGVFLQTKDVSLAYVATNDGAATTLMLSENVDATTWHDNAAASSADMYRSAIIWPAPAGFNQAIDTMMARPSSRHSGGFVATFCDGHTVFLSDQIATTVYEAIMTPNGKAATPSQLTVLDEADLK